MKPEKKKLIELLKVDLINNPIESGAPIYQPIQFPEFKDIKTSLNRDNFIRKYELISKHIPKELHQIKIIDIGSNSGFFSFNCIERGAIVDALEPSSRYFNLCKKLIEIYNVLNINLINKPISMEFYKNKKYDYGFMLSVFQWISEGNRKLEFAKNILMETSKHVDTLFFELGCNSGKSSVRTKKVNHLSVLFFLLRNNTVYKNIKLIGTTRIWGSYPRYLFICSNKDFKVGESFFYSFLKWINI